MTANEKKMRIAIIIPVYREEKNIIKLHQRLEIDNQLFLRRLCSALYYWLMAKISKLDITVKSHRFPFN